MGDRWSAGARPGKVLRKSAGAGGGRETFDEPCGRRKALKGEAQECYELKEACKGIAS
jgi:hypothetical protein